MGLSGFVECSQNFVIGDGGGEILEIEFGEAPGEEFFRPERDGRVWELEGVSLLGRPDSRVAGGGEELAERAGGVGWGIARGMSGLWD